MHIPRLLRMSLFGFCIHGALGYLFYRWLMTAFEGRDINAVLKRVSTKVDDCTIYPSISAATATTTTTSFFDDTSHHTLGCHRPTALHPIPSRAAARIHWCTKRSCAIPDLPVMPVETTLPGRCQLAHLAYQSSIQLPFRARPAQATVLESSPNHHQHAA